MLQLDRDFWPPGSYDPRTPWTDEGSEAFRGESEFGAECFDYEEADVCHWEHRMPPWGALADQGHDISTSFTYRGRLINFLKPFRGDRVADQPHRGVIQHLWPEVLETPLDTKTNPRTMLRKFAERWFFQLNSDLARLRR